MTVNLFSQPAKGYGPEPRVTRFSFAPNGTSDPLVASNHGPPGIKAATITYSATGIYTIVFPVDFAPPTNTVFGLTGQVDAIANYFALMIIGAYVASTRTLVVQAHRAGTGQAVAAAAGNRIHISMTFNDSTGG